MAIFLLRNPRERLIMRRILLLAMLLVPVLAGAAESKRDSLWQPGHDYRQWIYDQNKIGDRNSNLDPEIEFISNKRIRTHPADPERRRLADRRFCGGKCDPQRSV